MQTLFTADGHNRAVAASTVADLLTKHEVFWLDIQAPDDNDYQLLTDTFKFHQLTIEDVKHQNQRPKLDGYDGYVFAVVFVIALTGEEVSFREHHLYIAPTFLVTVHMQPEPSFDKLNERIAEMCIRDRNVRAGAEVDIIDANGAKLRFKVTTLVSLHRSGEPPGTFTTTGPALLTLYTCAGVWEPGAETYSQRLFVEAVPLHVKG